ncbi:MAG TPA: transglycosylase SLT domain-containing protein, partial [Anaeromyxobacteraceae bacterium]|nr:transglycosylase SLT domain-containing protein [Anaeromyxobacteraceae bacterium]
ALALEAGRRPVEAEEALSPAVDSLPAALRPAALARRGRLRLAAGHPADAAQDLAAAAAAAAEPERPALLAAEARAWLSAGEPARAERAAAPCAATGDPACRIALARAWSAAGDPRAAQALRDLAVDRAGEPDGEEAAAILRRDGRGGLAVADQLERARRLVASTRTAAALAELDALPPEISGAPLPVLLRSLAMLQLGRPAEAERLAGPVARLPGPGEPAAARLVLARAAARQGRVDEAVALYARVARERPTVPGLGAAAQADLGDDAAYLAAWLPYEDGRYLEAARGLRAFLRRHPNARRAGDARWFVAWSTFRAGDREGARTAFRGLAASEAGAVRAGALYWLARLEPEPARATALYRSAAVEAPGTWYALLAAPRLEALLQAPPPDPPLPPSGVPPGPPDARLAVPLARSVDLAAAGLRAEASALLQRLSRGPEARAGAVHLAEVAAFVGDPEVAYRMARDHLPPGIRARRWSYPLAHAEVLLPAARALGVDPALALAAMRRESAFVASARSGAAAEGVLQLRPETARRLLAVAGVDASADLLDPAENLRLGVAYLGLLGDRFAEPVQALAAYNAGPPAVASWARTRAGLPVDEWAEEVPYRETRQYVRNVLADRARYRALLGEPPAPVDPAAPVPPPAAGVAF